MADAEKIVRDVAERVREVITDAEERAAAIVSEAEADARRIRERAEAEGRERLVEVRKALDELQGKLGAGKDEVDPGPVTVPEPTPPPVPEPTPDPVPEPSPPPPEPAPEPVPEPTPPPDEGTPPSAGNGGAKSDDAVAARLVATNMALDGASREEIERAVTDGYELDDADQLIDDVLAKTAK